MPGIIPANSPNTLHYSDTSQMEWQKICQNDLDSILDRTAFESEAGPRFKFYTIPKADDSGTQGVQLYDRNWTVHVQCMLHGDEESRMKYGLTSNHILISLDVEKGPANRHAQYDDIPLQEAVLSAVINKATNNIGQRATMWDGRGHHIVWEPLRFAPSCEQCIHQAAEIMALYARILLPDATYAMSQWADANEVTLGLLL